MKQTRKEYISPAVIERLELELENPILGGSVVDSVSGVQTGGQSVGTVYEDASSTGGGTFNHAWGE